MYYNLQRLTSLVCVGFDESRRLQALESVPIPFPVLMAHGDADQLTDFGAAKRFFEKIEAPDKVFKTYEDGRHVCKTTWAVTLI